MAINTHILVYTIKYYNKWNLNMWLIFRTTWNEFMSYIQFNICISTVRWLKLHNGKLTNIIFLAEPIFRCLFHVIKYVRNIQVNVLYCTTCSNTTWISKINKSIKDVSKCQIIIIRTLHAVFKISPLHTSKLRSSNLNFKQNSKEWHLTANWLEARTI